MDAIVAQLLRERVPSEQIREKGPGLYEEDYCFISLQVVANLSEGSTAAFPDALSSP